MLVIKIEDVLAKGKLNTNAEVAVVEKGEFPRTLTVEEVIEDLLLRITPNET